MSKQTRRSFLKQATAAGLATTFAISGTQGVRKILRCQRSRYASAWPGSTAAAVPTSTSLPG